MRFVWIETETITRNHLVANMAQIMLEMNDQSEKYISVVRNNDEDDTWIYRVTDSSIIVKDEDSDDKEENFMDNRELEVLAQFDDLGQARASEYGIYFLMSYLFVVAETTGLDEHDDALVEAVCDIYQNASDGKLLALLKRAPNGQVAVMRAAISLDDAMYVQGYIQEFKNDEKGPSRFMEFNPSPKIEKILLANGGIHQVTDWDIKEVRDKIKAFNEERDWDKFHTPENLAKSISIEAGELLECFQWDNKFDRQRVAEELADVMSYCIIMADRINIDLKQEMLRKIALNGAKYPVKKAKGNSVKYTKL